MATGPEAFVSRKVKVTWVDNSTIETGFTIERWNTAKAIYETRDRVVSDTQIWYDTKIDFNKPYYYRIRGYTAGSQSNYSNVGSNR